MCGHTLLCAVSALFTHTPVSPPQVEMPVLPHGAEPVTCQADLLLIPHTLVMSKDGVPWSSLHFQDHLLWPQTPPLSLYPPGLLL